MKFKDTGSKDFAPAPEGTHEAWCIGVIDIGTQTGQHQGQPTSRHKVVVSWELPTALMDNGKPFIVSKFYTTSLSEKATLRKDLESWRGRPFTKEELLGFDAKNIIGKPCLVNITHGETGKAKVLAVMSIPKGMQLPPQQNPSTFFSMERGEFDEEVFNKIGKGLQDMIRKSPEYAAATGNVETTEF